MSSSRTSQHLYSRLSSSFRRVSSRLQHWMEHHPVVSNALLCLNLWVAGDALAQYSEFRHDQKHKQKHITDKEETFLSSYNVQRTAKCAGFGACFTGPLLAVWYPYLDRVSLQYNLAARYGVWGPPIFKVWADEFLMDPPCIVTFFGYMAVWEAHEKQNDDNETAATTKEIFQSKLQHQFFPSWVTSLIAWPPILLGTFRFLPVYAQAPVINVCCIVWDAFLSHRNSLSTIHDDDNDNDDKAGECNSEQEEKKK